MNPAKTLPIGKSSTQELLGASVTGDLVASQDILGNINDRLGAIEDRIFGSVPQVMIGNEMQPDGIGNRAQQIRLALTTVEERLMKILEIL